MTTQIIMRKVDGALVPVDDEGREIVSKLPADKDFFVTPRVPRQFEHHRKLFFLLKTVVENSDLFTTVEQALITLKIALGMVKPYISKADGNIFYVPDSIAFESMEQSEFNRFYDRALYVIIQRWLVGTDQDALREEILALTEDKRDSRRRQPGALARRQSIQAQEEAAADEPQAPAAKPIPQKLERDPETGMLLSPPPHDFESYKFEIERLWENAVPADEQRLIEKWAAEGMPNGLRNTIGLTDEQREDLKAYVLKSRARLRKEDERQP